ncbi:universal stress protein [Halobacillus yeomjeoni]|uniref:Universal stress protein n=1 Tax=Halobacillus yeomjeoni TaxID=311194 RepID=A0A931HRA4_9BACI|nr:universal stress protein [Halobacillus yeomjeoni]MBH0228665.1 universal stress protein [Halobacillus yeomjeoni]MCA0983932.1 universal stress protein [Halobacillus yeomjeoni]
MYKNILLAADGSEHSVRTAERAAELALLQGDGEVTIIYVIDREQAKSDVLSEGDQGMVDQLRHKRLSPIEELLEERNVPYHVEIQHGEPGPSIVQHANENEFDIVIIGSRGLNTLQEMVLGSVSHKVAKRANCPVMIVK